MQRSITPGLASRFARLALSHMTREYPNLLYHVLNEPNDIRGPRDLHPIFFGSMDWHSCVHCYWLLSTLLRIVPESPEASEIRELLDAQLTPANVQGELEYLAQPLRNIFERPYGWAWLLMLSAELNRHDTDDGRRWSNLLNPLAEEFVRRFLDFLPKATYPTRVGTHFNSAFALTLALEYSEVMSNKPLRRLLVDRANVWYRNDVDCQAWEPGGDDFLSPALMEAECMRRILSASEFRDWFDRFLPRLGERQPATLFEPAIVSDRTDGKIAHLDGLNLSRAWCWRSLATVWPDADPRHAIALDAADVHLEAGLAHVAGDYMGEHWLATFALLALI
ncbi:MAG TPA: DUF2891 domain-containing protein [Gemmatimonadaceae bacterium]|nr:DUF2891 domain-containing protein [Gemmatimonadaceae bacterium]